MQIRVAPIVEGHGEVASIRVLLQRIGAELLGGVGVEVLQPIRVHRADVRRPSKLGRMVDLAQLKLDRTPPAAEVGFVLVLLDADPDPRPPCESAPELLTALRSEREHLDVACVLANPEWETWFVAAAPSLQPFLDLSGGSPERPEETRSAKAWIRQRFLGARYSETADQPGLTARMDLRLCRQRSPSFDKLCRELERRLPA